MNKTKIIIDPLINFSSESGTSKYGEKSKEYSLLKSMSPEEWAAFTAEMKEAGVKVEFNSASNKYVVIGSI